MNVSTPRVAALNAGAQATPITRLEAVHEHVLRLRTRVAGQAQRTCAIADRLLGATRNEAGGVAGSNSAAPQPPVVDRIEEALASVSDAIDAVEAQLDRLQSL